MSHIRFSPSKPNPHKHGVRPDTLLSVEDARVNQRALRAGIGDSIREFIDLSIPLPDPRVGLRRATLLLVACHGTLQYDYVEKEYGKAGDAGQMAIHLARRAISAFTKVEKPSFRRTIKVSRMLDRLLDLSEGGVPEGIESLLLRSTEIPVPRLAPEIPAEAPARKRVRPAWGRLETIEEPPRTLPFSPGKLARSVRATDEGSLLRFPHRYLVDRKIFARRRRLPGGTMLVDGSGSMRLTSKDLLAIAEVAPAAEIACYEGKIPDTGALRILVRDGRRVEDSLFERPLKTGANVVDGPALEWLARRPPPRIWVSDGEVRGIGDQASPLLFEDAVRICKKAGIVRVRDASAARQALRRSYLSPSPAGRAAASAAAGALHPREIPGG
jgi:hypothetical protein